jgi:hypothetical protein
MFVYYACNCFWLMAPVLALNLLLMNRLPENYQPQVFSRNISQWISAGEVIFRGVIFLLPLLMPLGIAGHEQRLGILIYLFGMILYALSWMIEILFPESAWSASRWGFMAPAYTPLVWLCGIALVGRTLYFAVPYSPWIYAGVSAVFLLFHNLHCWIVYSNSQPRGTTKR